MITFKKQFDKLTEAYIRGEVDACNSCACFVGNLLNGESDWRGWFGSIGEKNPSFGLKSKEQVTNAIYRGSNGFYSIHEIFQLEKRFMTIYSKYYTISEEDALFLAFEKTLDLLKQIHESKGEVVEPFEFVKRQPVTV